VHLRYGTAGLGSTAAQLGVQCSEVNSQGVPVLLIFKGVIMQLLMERGVAVAECMAAAATDTLCLVRIKCQFVSAWLGR
jgi:hypothetical protein